jgi:methylthioribose-1-phosphate isomerase
VLGQLVPVLTPVKRDHVLGNGERDARAAEFDGMHVAVEPRRGAPAIGLAAAYGLAMETGDLQPAAELLRSARPTAVNLGWAVDRALAAHARGESLVDHANALAAAQLEQDLKIAEHAAELFPQDARVITHCNTGPLATGGAGTAGGAIEMAWRQGRLKQVWVDETRPLLQGARLTAWELSRAGIPFEVVTDSSAGMLMERGMVDVAIVGADRIAANGDVANKIGTYPLAVLAERHGVPFYVAAPESTIDPDTPTGKTIPIEERATDEVIEGAPARNFAFDVTPYELVTAIVTERGVRRPPFG